MSAAFAARRPATLCTRVHVVPPSQASSDSRTTSVLIRATSRWRPSKTCSRMSPATTSLMMSSPTESSPWLTQPRTAKIPDHVRGLGEHLLEPRQVGGEDHPLHGLARPASCRARCPGGSGSCRLHLTPAATSRHGSSRQRLERPCSPILVRGGPVRARLPSDAEMSACRCPLADDASPGVPADSSTAGGGRRDGRATQTNP